MLKVSLELVRRSLALGTGAALLALTACGGGSSSGGNSVANVYPNVNPTVGDYYAYQDTVTVGTGFTAPNPSVYTFVRYYTGSSPIGRTDYDSRSDGTSANFLKSIRAYDTNQKETTYTFGSTTCAFNPAFGLTPPLGATPNSTFSATSVRTCTGGTASTDNYTLTGTAVGLEDLTIVAGTFKAFKYTATRTIKNASNESTSTGTFWTDGVTGRALKSVLNVKVNTTGSTALIADTTFTTELISHNAQSLGSSAATVKRFSGGWTVPYTGAVTGSCAMTIAAAGTITGSCTGTGNSPSVSGTVSSAGALSVQLSDGTQITGTLSSPGAGSGTWVNGTASGNWTASHR
jgi:hypothetical protein